MPAPAVRPASAHDLPAIVTLLERSKLPTDGLAEHLATALVVRETGERGALLGCVALEVYDGAALLRSLAVAEAARGRGLGLALTRAALDLARAREVRTVYLLTETAGAFFPKFGFRRIAREAVDPAVRASVEFTTLCPASAPAMVLDLA
jgi:amino-acid N-acetyltransferase